jgi:hypothetical protein
LQVGGSEIMKECPKEKCKWWGSRESWDDSMCDICTRNTDLVKDQFEPIEGEVKQKKGN